MTAPLPTPDDLIALLSESVTWRTPTPEGPRATISPQWVERMAEEIHARLRPAFLEGARNASSETVDIFVSALQSCFENSVPKNTWTQTWPPEVPLQAIADQIMALRASLAHKDEALRACVEALERAHACATYDIRDGTCQGCFVSDALARAQEAGR